MNIQKYIIPSMIAIAMAGGLSSCLGDDDNTYDYTDWINQNEAYLVRMADTIGADGKKVFEKITPLWAPGVYILAQWHNDRSLTASNLVPMDNSTVDIKYDGCYVDGTMFDNSYSRTTPADSIYRCKPSDMIVGFWTMLTSMHVGDSVTCVIPTNAGYGTTSSSIRPYSTLVFHVKLNSIYKYEMPED